MPPPRDENDQVEARVISLVIDLGNTVLTKRAIGDLHRYLPCLFHVVVAS